MVLDVKPSNMLLEGGGGHVRAVLADFGLARVMQQGATRVVSGQSRCRCRRAGAALCSVLGLHTACLALVVALLEWHARPEPGPFLHLQATSTVQGTWAFMAPEQLSPEDFGGISPKADIWAFGACMVELLSGTPPFEGCSQTEIFRRVVFKRETPAMPLAAEASTALQQLLRACFSFDPRARPTAAEAQTQLRAARVEIGNGAPQPAPAAPAVAGAAQQQRPAASPEAQRLVMQLGMGNPVGWQHAAAQELATGSASLRSAFAAVPNALQQLVALVGPGSPANLQQAAAWALGSIADGGSSLAEQVAAVPNALDWLGMLLGPGSPAPVREDADAALRSIAAGNPRLRERVAAAWIGW
jgi:hypothetical protein